MWNRTSAGEDFVHFYNCRYCGTFYFPRGTPDETIEKFVAACGKLIALQVPREESIGEMRYHIKHKGVTIHISDHVSLNSNGAHDVFYSPWGRSHEAQKRFAIACAELINRHLSTE